MAYSPRLDRIRFVSFLLLIAVGGAASAQEATAAERGSRFELWLGATSWPALGDLQPVAMGSFDDIGFGIGAAFHIPVRKFESSELLLGIDAFISATDSSIATASNIQGLRDELLARHMFIGASAKWRFGAARNLSLDAGLGLNLADIATVESRYVGIENESWETTRLGAFVGATWDVGMSRPEKNRGFFLGFEVHFVDFGNVRDEDVFFGPLLGTNAGKLDGPIYMMQIGYSGGFGSRKP